MRSQTENTIVGGMYDVVTVYGCQQAAGNRETGKLAADLDAAQLNHIGICGTTAHPISNQKLECPVPCWVTPT